MAGNALKGRLARDTGLMFMGQGVSFIVQGLYFVLLARLLGANQYGIFVGAVAGVSILSQYSSLGSGMVLIRQVSRNRANFAQYWANVLLTTLSIGFVVILLLMLLGHWMVGPASAAVILQVAVAECICARLTEAAGQAFQAVEHFKLTAALASITNVARLFTAAGMTFTLQHATVRQWAWASLSVSFVSAVIALYLVTRILGRPRFSLPLLRRHALEGVGFSIAASTTSVYNDIDKAILSRYGMTTANGIYSMAYRVVDISCTPVRSLHSAAFPRFCKLGLGGIRCAIPFTRKLLHKTLPFSLIIAAALFFAAPLIPYIVGNSFQQSAAALRWLCLLPVFRALHLSAGDTLTGAGYQRYRTGSQIFAAALNLGLNVWLIPSYSWYGAAWASLIADGVLVIGNWTSLTWILSREHRLKDPERASRHEQ